MRDWFRGISDFKKAYWPKTNIVENEKSYLVIDSHSVSDGWRKLFSQLFLVHGNRNSYSRATSA